MEKASKVMYSIANVFNWIIAILTAFLIVMSALAMANVLPADLVAQANLGRVTLVYAIIAFLVALLVIILVRRAKSSNSSKGWDIFFIVVGVLEGNIFYILGGIFGLIAIRR